MGGVSLEPGGTGTGWHVNRVAHERGGVRGDCVIDFFTFSPLSHVPYKPTENHAKFEHSVKCIALSA